jgi:sialic acid synthase SpsE
VDFVTGNTCQCGPCLVQALKIGSGGLEPDLIRYVGVLAEQEKIPVIMSTGMCDWPKVRRSVTVLAKTGCKFALMHCVSAYPALATDMNLAMIRKLETFGVPVGLSSHNDTAITAELAVAAGAKIFEAHITLDPEDKRGPDHRMSLNPTAFGIIVQSIRWVEKVMGDGKKRVLECERGTMKILKERHQ